MKNQILAAGVAAVLGFGSVAPGMAQAASNDELAQIRSLLERTLDERFEGEVPRADQRVETSGD